MFKNVSKETIARTVVLAVALLNNILSIIGINPLPFSDTQIYEVISGIFTAGASIWAWWKNNSFTQAAIEGDKVMNELKEEAKVNNSKTEPTIETNKTESSDTKPTIETSEPITKDDSKEE